MEATDEERAHEEAFLLGVQEGIANDIEFVKRGGLRSYWSGSRKSEILERLHRHKEGVSRAIQHVRDGGPLDDVVAIVLGEK